MDRRRPALALRGDDVRRTGSHAALRGRRVCLPARRLRRHARFPLHVDVVRRGQAGLDRRRDQRPGQNPGRVSGLSLARRVASRPVSAALVAGVCHRGHLVHDRAELPGHQEGRRFPACLHGAQGHPDPDRGRSLLCFGNRLVGQLHHFGSARGGRDQRLHGGPDCHACGPTMAGTI